MHQNHKRKNYKFKNKNKCYQVLKRDDKVKNNKWGMKSIYQILLLKNKKMKRHHFE